MALSGSLITTSIALCACLSVTLAIAGDTPVPSYQDALTKFKAERSKGGGPKISEADKVLMQKAAEKVAAALPDPGLKVGESAPDFSLPNANGKIVTLSEELAKGPVVLSFYRGAWCPYCNLQLKQLRDVLPAIQAKGAQLITVTPQKPDKSLEQVKQDGYPFEILSDLDDKVMDAYKLKFTVPAELSDVYMRNFGLDLAAFNGDGRYVLPVPGTYVLDQNGVVRAAFNDTDYTQRMEPASILQALDEL